MIRDLPFELVELVPCPACVAPAPAGPLRETVFRRDAWLPDDIATLRAEFHADQDLAVIADRLGRTLAAVRSKIDELGLRRNSQRPWTELEEEYLAQHYGLDPTSTIALATGRSTAAVYARAQLLGLSEGNPPPYTCWEDAQLRAGYATGVPVAHIAILVGRPCSGVVSRASLLGLRHANKADDWSDAERGRALALAETGQPYRQITACLADEGYPRREIGALGQMLRKIGYERGWGRPWLEDEDALLRLAYMDGRSLTPLIARLGRSKHSIRWRAACLKLQGTHVNRNGWRTEPAWTLEQMDYLRAQYGRLPAKKIADVLGRKLGGVYNKAHALGLDSGWLRPFSEDEDRAIRIAHGHGISIVDLAQVLGRDTAVVSKHAIRLGISFANRARLAPRTPRNGRPALTLAAILTLAA
jgi:hypothetical protein